MKTLILLVLLSITANIAYPQKIEVKKISDKNLIDILFSAEDLVIKKANAMRISLFTINNGSGSANLPESDEVSFNIIVIVSSYDENPEAHAYSLGPFIKPRILNSK